MGIGVGAKDGDFVGERVGVVEGDEVIGDVEGDNVGEVEGEAVTGDTLGKAVGEAVIVVSTMDAIMIALRANPATTVSPITHPNCPLPPRNVYRGWTPDAAIVNVAYYARRYTVNIYVQS